MICKHHQHRVRRGGYILVVTLGALVLASTLLVGLGRACMRHASDARAAEHDLQRRWGAASCRQTLLPIAERLLDGEEFRQAGPVASFSVSLRLGGQTFDLTLADEQAKADINAMLADVDAATAEARIRRALTGHGLADKVRLRPDPAALARGPGGDPARPPPIGSFGQVFDNLPPDRWLRPPIGGGPAPTDLMTCWGDGRINIRRATEPALRLAASPPLTTVEIGRLLDLRNQIFHAVPGSTILPGPPASGAGRSPIRRLVESAGLTAAPKRIVSSFVDGSTRHSLWVSSSDGGRRWHSFAVLDTTNVDRPRWLVQSW